ncbi:MAG: IPT/TIG domain-containing protein [Acidobacteriota bacterium]
MRMRRPGVLMMILLVVLALLTAACESDSPTLPEQAATSTPTSDIAPSAAYVVTVIASPDAFEFAAEPETTTSNILVTVRARRTDNGQAPPDGASIIVSSSGGSLISDSGATTSAVLNLDDGVSSVTLQVSTGDIDSSIVVQAQIEQSFGQDTVAITQAEPTPDPPPPAPFFLTGIVPNTGPPEGIEATILGNGFSSPLRVTIDTQVAQILSASSGSIRIRVPPIFDLPVGQIRSVDVTVTNNFNDTDPDSITAADTLASAFTYTRDGGSVIVPRIISVTPAFGPNEGGTQITIRGEGFSNQVQVFVGAGNARVEAQLQSVSPSRIVAITPAATGPNAVNQNRIVDVQVVNLNSGSQDTLAGAFQYGSAGSVVITALSPNEGPFTGGQLVTVFGTGFEEPVAVSMAGFGQEIVSVTGTEIVVRTPGIIPNGCSDESGAVSVTNVETAESGQGPSYTYRVFDVVVTDVSPNTFTTTADGSLVGAPNVEINLGPIGASGIEAGDPVSVEIDGNAALGVVAVNSGGQVVVRARVPNFFGTFETDTCLVGGQDGEILLPTPTDLTITSLRTTCTQTLTNAIIYDPPSDCQVDPAPPEASFVISGTTGTTVNFVNTSTGADSYTWFFGDGSSCTAPGVDPACDLNGATYTYPPIAATYTVTLQASNQFGTSTASNDVTITPP